MIKHNRVGFVNIIFKNCEVVGVGFHRFDQEGFKVNFEKCFLKQCSFNQISIPGTKFSECKLQDVDFDETNLEGANFRKARFKDCSFHKCNLRESIFLRAEGFVIDPTMNDMYNSRFSKSELYGLVKGFGVKIGGK